MSVSVCVCVFAIMRGTLHYTLRESPISCRLSTLWGFPLDGGVFYYAKSWTALQMKALIAGVACVDGSCVILICL